MKLSTEKEYMLALAPTSLPYNLDGATPLEWPTELGATIPVTESGIIGHFRGCHGFSKYFTHSFIEKPWYILEVDCPKPHSTYVHEVTIAKKATVTYIGDLYIAAELLKKRYPKEPVHFATHLTSSNSTAIVGDYGFASAHNNSNLLGGNHSTVRAHENCNIISGAFSTVNVGKCSTVSAGSHSTVITRRKCKITTGNFSGVMCGTECVIVTGAYSTVITRRYSTVYAQEGTMISIGYYCENTNMWKYATDRVASDRLKSNTQYTLSKDNNIEEVT